MCRHVSRCRYLIPSMLPEGSQPWLSQTEIQKYCLSHQYIVLGGPKQNWYTHIFWPQLQGWLRWPVSFLHGGKLQFWINFIFVLLMKKTHNLKFSTLIFQLGKELKLILYCYSVLTDIRMKILLVLSGWNESHKFFNKYNYYLPY